MTKARKTATGTSSRALGLAGLLALLALAILPVPAQATDQHVFDATLSLTGDCTVSSFDEVPDPGCPGPAHPSAPFFNACGVATDRLGDIYVASVPYTNSGYLPGRIDVFDPEGRFLTEIEGVPHRACRLAVDSQGRIYSAPIESGKVIRYAPKSFPPPDGAL